MHVCGKQRVIVLLILVVGAGKSGESGDWGFGSATARELLAAAMHAKLQKITESRSQNGQNGL